MARFLPTLAFVAVLVAAETLAKSLKSGFNPAVRDGLAAALSKGNRYLGNWGYGGYYGYGGYPYGGYYGKSSTASESREDLDSCGDGGIQLTATNLTQTFGVMEYTNNLDCTWNITADPGMVIFVEIIEYEIENAFMCQYDYLSVGAGDGSNVHLCGEGSFSGYSVGTELDLHFHTDFCVTHNGFLVEFVQIPAAFAPQRVTMQAAETTGLALTSETEEIILTSHSGFAYENNMNYTTTVTAPQGKMVMVSVQAFDVEYSWNCSYDFVTIYNSNGSLVDTWCGSQLSGNTAVSMDNMTIWFHTDHSVTASGFMFELSVVDPADLPPYVLPNYLSNACPGPMEILDVTDAREIASPNFGMAQYANDMSCSWKISAAAGKYLSVTFLEMDIEFHGSCEWDSLSFFDGADTSNLLAKKCGNIAPATFTSSGPDMVIVFATDHVVTHHGFLLEISAVDEPIIIPEDPCNAIAGPMHVTEDGALIASPVGMNDFYPPNSNCSWVIQSPDPAQTVTFTFTSFDIEDATGCWYDSLSFYNSDSIDPENLIGTYCGESSPGSITSSGDVLLISFTSDYCVQYDGFSGHISFGNEVPTEPQTESDSSWWAGDWTSTGDFDGSMSSGDFSSPPTTGKTTMVNWSSPAKKSKKEKDEAALKRDFAEVLRKGAQHSRKLVEFFRAVNPQQRPLFTTLAIAAATGAATAVGSNAASSVWSWFG